MNWYGVKTLYRIHANGKPNRKDAEYQADATLIEERVVLFQAGSSKEAIALAETEAKEYAADSLVNPYGQRVTMRYLETCDVYELPSKPGKGAEVYSATEVVSVKIEDDEILDRRFGVGGDSVAEFTKARKMFQEK